MAEPLEVVTPWWVYLAWDIDEPLPRGRRFDIRARPSDASPKHVVVVDAIRDVSPGWIYAHVRYSPGDGHSDAPWLPSAAHPPRRLIERAGD